jgi:hypothetical protein
MRRFLGSIVCTSALLATADARADDAAVAEALFRSGREAMDRGDHATACEKFKESQRLDPAAGTLLNLADCSERLGRTATAWRAYAEAVERLPPSDDRVGPVRQKLEALEPTLGRARFTVEPSAQGCEVDVDDTHLGAASFGEPIPFDPGKRGAVLRCPGRVDRAVPFEIRASALVEVKLVPGELAKRDDLGREAGTAGTSSPLVPLGWVLGVTGVASFGASAVTGVLTLDRKDTVDTLCTGTSPRQCPKAGVDAASEGTTLSTVSTATFVAGGVLTALGVTFLIVGYGADDEPARAMARVRVGPLSGVSFDASF